MNKRYWLALVFVCQIFVLANAMPPNPKILSKIRNGELPKPVFVANPDYKVINGIDQGLDEPLFEPRAMLANYNFLTILIGFSDQPGMTPPQIFDSLVYGGNPLPGSWGPSLRTFYLRASYGTFNITTVNIPSSLGWTASPFSKYYYTQMGGSYSHGMGTYPNNSQALCEMAINIVDPMVNFANYDNNSDGFVDGIIIIHSGPGAEITGDTLDIWSHEWGITPQTRDGVQIVTYSVVPEYRYTWAPNDNTVGVFAHEFGHVLGLPDFYDYGYDSYGLGEWSLMATGSWNGNRGGGDVWSGCSPAFLDAYSRVFLGFVTPTNVAYDMLGATIPPVEDSAKVYRLWTHGTLGQEYFLVEHRSFIYTDTALANMGLTIYHVDETQPNNDNQWWPGMPPTPHYKVALEQADNFFQLEHNVNGMDFGDPYPGATVNPAFATVTFPSSNNYNGIPTMVSVSNIVHMPPIMIIADLVVGIIAPACNYLPGDISGDHQRLGADVTYGVRFFKGIGNVPPDSCRMDSTGTYLYVAGDVNGNCEFRGSDITRLVSYFKGTAGIAFCHFFPPPPLR
jgi:M6 family metalloprotease-like protein